MRFSKTVAWCAGVLLLCGAGIALCTFVPVTHQSNEMLAREQIVLCGGLADPEKKELCYEKRIPALMDRGLSFDRAFAVLGRVIELDNGYQSCHTLGHILAAREVDKDPDKWKDVITQVPEMGTCAAGAIHGAFLERFHTASMPEASAATLASLLDGMCDARSGWEPTSQERGACLHGMGHLLLYVTDADAHKASALCETLARSDIRDWQVDACLSGVFMQLYQPRDADDQALIASVKDVSQNPAAFCAGFRGASHAACIAASWPAVPDILTDPHVLEAHCQALHAPENVTCAREIMNSVVHAAGSDPLKLKQFCSGLQDTDIQRECWRWSASRVAWDNFNDMPVSFAMCADTPERFRDDCWQALVDLAHSALHAGSPYAPQLCGGLPEPYRSECARNQGVSL